MNCLWSILLLTLAKALDFVLVDETKTWDAAELYCEQRYKTNLATIADDASATAILSIASASSTDPFIGLTDQDSYSTKEGLWTFADYTTCPTTDGDCVAYWNTGEPSNSGDGEDCALIRRTETDINLMLNDGGCTHEAPFICNKPEPEYVLETENKTWGAAEARCESQYGTTLATIFDDDSAQTLLDMRLEFGENVWIGLNDLNIEGTYEWTSGVLCPHDTGCSLSYPYWMSVGGGDNWDNVEHCIEISGTTSDINDMLNDAPCDNRYSLAAGFICDAPSDWGSLSCPSGSTEIGTQGGYNDISGCGLQTCDARYGSNYATIEACEAACEVRNDCESYTWAPSGGDQNVPLETVCTLYDSEVPDQQWDYQQIMCKPSCKEDPLAALDGLLTLETDGLGWIKAFECTNTIAASLALYSYSAPFTDFDGFVYLAQYAKSIKFETEATGIYITAVECGNPVQALNLGLEMSQQIDSSGKITGYGVSEDWTGNNSLAWNTCYGGYTEGSDIVGDDPRPLSEVLYWACNNAPGLHMMPKSPYYSCSINEDGVNPVSISLGFDPTLATDCYGDLTCPTTATPTTATPTTATPTTVPATVSPTTATPTTAIPTTATPTTATPTTATPTTTDIGIVCGNASTFVWEELMGKNIGKPNLNYTLEINETTLTLNIDIKLDYLGATAADDNGYKYGTTYVIDFEDFDAHKDNIREAGTCQNRDSIATSTAWTDVWSYSTTPNTSGHIESSSYLAYGPSTVWDISMDDNDPCGTVEYSASFTWSELTSCTDYSTTVTYITTDDTETEITLSGTLYVNVVSPLAYNGDYNFYRVYQLLSQPFEIALSKTIYVVEGVGINLLQMQIISVYKEDVEATFKLILLTESAEYLQLSRSGYDTDYLTQFEPYDSNTGGLTASDFEALRTTENVGCISSKAHICRQLWQIKATNAQCNGNDRWEDFSGRYSMQFDPICRTDMNDTDLVNHCNSWLTVHKSQIVDETDKVLLSSGIMWKDTICEPEIFNVQFTAEMAFFATDLYATEVSDTHLYEVGEGIIYVEISTDYPSDHFAVFETELKNVWICTFDPTISVPPLIADGTANGGCFLGTIDNNTFVDHIYESETGKSFEEFVLNTPPSDDVVRFQFDVPESVIRDELYIHAHIEVSLSTARRRILIDVAKEANQMNHFVDRIGIAQEPYDKPKPQSPIHDYHPHEAPQHRPSVLSLNSPWVITIGCLLGLVLTVNVVFICYMHCAKHNQRTYSAVKSTDSEYSEHDAINVVSD